MDAPFIAIVIFEQPGSSELPRFGVADFLLAQILIEVSSF
jgi:hypothetical protein